MNNFLSDKKSAHALFSIFENFEQLSGLKVNTSKTEGKWLGSLKNSSITPLGIKWTTEPTKGLRLYYSYNKTNAINCNFLGKLKDLKQTLNM